MAPDPGSTDDDRRPPDGAAGSATDRARIDYLTGDRDVRLTAADQAWLLCEAATRLRALGRLTEALQPMRAGLEMAVQQKDWENAAIYASNLSELELTLEHFTPQRAGEGIRSGGTSFGRRWR